MADVKHLDTTNFDSETAGKVALVDFWAEWCGPCRMLGPVLDEVAKEIGDEALVAKVDVDKAQELAAKFSVRSIPAIFVIKDGSVVQQFVGVQDKQTLINAVKAAL
ncbi:MAG: thioredoxin [Victivallales bacterium]|nr:thioredoxin [Victivallales bacterium]